MLMHGCYLLLSGASMAALTGWALMHDKTIFEFNDGAIFNLGNILEHQNACKHAPCSLSLFYIVIQH